jgi:mRNA interferase RelE/StbE
MYKPRFLKSFLKQEKILPKDLKERVIRITKEILEDPHSGVMLKGDLRGYWRKRIGEYRIIYRIDEDAKVVIFLDIGLRKKIYETIRRKSM